MIIAVLCGGTSEEQELSRASGESVMEALTTLGHAPVMVEYDEKCVEQIRAHGAETVFHIVQGKHHGDGAVQALLSLMGIPYTGSRPAAAAIINDKIACKRLWAASGIRTPAFFSMDRSGYEAGYAAFVARCEAEGVGMPCVVKAPTQGSRHGMVFVDGEAAYERVRDVFRYDDVLLCERFVEGRFLTQGVIEQEGQMTVLPAVELLDASEARFKLFYGAQLPSQAAPAAFAGTLAETSLRAAHCVGAGGHARLDYHLSGGRLELLEINAVPGLRRSYSDLLKCAKLAGWDYEELVRRILAAAR